MRTALTAAAIGLLMAQAQADERRIVLCEAEGKTDVVLSINDRQEFDRSLSCIAGDFVFDMTPCAPEGGYGLSYPTGSAALASVVDRWQDYGDHHGGITSFAESSTTIVFSGGFFYSGSWSETDRWSFIADRLSGKGTLTLDDVVTTYQCRSATQLF